MTLYCITLGCGPLGPRGPARGAGFYGLPDGTSLRPLEERLGTLGISAEKSVRGSPSAKQHGEYTKLFAWGCVNCVIG